MKSSISVTEYNIIAPVDLTLVFLSDLHNYPNESILEIISQHHPDAVLVGGDFADESGSSRQDVEFFKAVCDIAATFCVIGNHEKCWEAKTGNTIRERLKGTNTTVLYDDYVLFHGIYIGGLTSTSGTTFSKPEPPNTGWLEDFGKLDGYKILLCHHPEYYESYIKALPIELTLSGHAHGGQWRFFGKGVFAPGQGFFPKYTCGLYDNRMIVSRGIGNYHLIPRINNKPEIVLLNLRAQ